MKILLLFPMADGQTGPAIKYSFEKLGHTVKAVDAKLRPGDSYKTACEFKPDLVFCSRTTALTEQVVKIKKKMNVIACTWNVDTRATVNSWTQLYSLIRASDYYFVVASRLIPEWRKINEKTFWLPQGLQDEIYRKPKKLDEKDIAKYKCEASFCGDIKASPHRFRPAFLNTIRKSNVNFKHWAGVYNEEHNKMAALSKVNIGLSGWPKNVACVSVRNYKLMGAGGFVLELYRAGLDQIFPLNIIDQYKNPEELVLKIKHWLSHEKERNEIADKGFHWVRENATYTHRIKMALDYMKC